jgi:CII-binding regulator of phage lambda lysogenization HflD
MDSELYNTYIEKLVNSVTELTKSNLVLSAQVSYYEKIVASLNNKIEQLEKPQENSDSKDHF